MISLTIIIFLVSSTVATIPVHYEIIITPNFSELKFSSETKLTIAVEEPIVNLTLNSKNLVIEDVQFLDSTSEPISGVTVDENPETESLIINFSEQLSENLYWLIIKSSGKINENLEGFYVAKYQTGGEESTIYLTDFQYNKARQVFPCFDDPTKPSIFTFTIITPKSYIAVANTPITSVDQDDSTTDKYIFARTDALPTHLLNFAIIDFTATIKDDTTIYSHPSKNSSVQFLVDLSQTAISYFENYYLRNLHKIYQIVVPDNLLSKAVLVNIGLIIYRESSVLFDASRDNLEDKQEIAKIIALAIARQFSKDKDSYHWWTNYWVQEGEIFSDYLEVFNKIQPSWRIRDQFLTEELSELIENEEVSLVLTESHTPNNYNDLHLIKSFAFVRMLSHLPVPGDVLENESNTVAISWIQNLGFPSVSVSRNYENNKFTFIQNLPLRNLPINVIFQNQNYDYEHFDFLLSNQTNYYDLTSYPQAEWYLANMERLGYYRPNYDSRNWRSLALSLTSSQSEDINKISAINKAIIIQDLAYFANAESQNYTLYLDLIQYLKRETDYIPINSFINTAIDIKNKLAFTFTQQKFMKFSVSLLEHLYEQIGTNLQESEEHLITLSRIRILTWMCNFGYEKCQKEMNEILKQSSAVKPDLHDLVYCGGMRTGNIENFNFLTHQYGTHHKKRILKSMSCTSDIQILRYLIDAVVDESSILHIEPEDKIDAFIAVVENSDEGVDAALDFSKQYLEQILETFNDEEITTLFTALSKRLITNNQLQRIDEIIECLNDEQKIKFEQLFSVVKNNILQNQHWQNVHVTLFENWLNANMPEEVTTPAPTNPPGNTTTSVEEPTTTQKPGGNSGTQLQISVALFAFIIVQFFNF